VIAWLGLGYGAIAVGVAAHSFVGTLRALPRLRTLPDAFLTAGLCSLTGAVWPFVIGRLAIEEWQKRPKRVDSEVACCDVSGNGYHAKDATAPAEWPSPKNDTSLPAMPLEELDAELPKVSAAKVLHFPTRGGRS
jgi:hypothetical protein